MEEHNRKRIPLREIINREKGILIFILLMVLFPFVMGTVTGTGINHGVTKFWQGQLIAFFIMAVLAMSYDLLIGYCGILSFGHAAFFGAGAYTTALLFTHWAPGFSSSYKVFLPFNIEITGAVIFIFIVFMAILASILVGLLFSATSIRLKGSYFAMLTLALAEALHILAKASDFIKWTGADEGLHGVPVPAWINPTQFRPRFYFIALGFLFVSYLIIRRFTKSPVGKVIVGTRENEERIRMIGFNPATYRTITFVVSAIFAGLAGMMFSMWNMSATHSMTSTAITVNALIMVILGGMGTLVGGIIGAGLLQAFSHFFYDWFGPRWPLVFGLLFIVIVLFFPYGIVGTWQLKRLQLREGWARFLALLSVKKK